MKKKIISLVLVLVLISLFLSACSGATAASSWPGVTVSKNVIYAAYGSFVYAIRSSDGSMAWRYPDKADTRKSFYATPEITPDGQLIVGDYANVLHSLNINSGQEAWTFTGARSRWVGPVLVGQDMIYAPNADYSVYALDFTGKLQWSFKTKQAVWAQPALDANALYVASMDHFLYALSPKDGSQIWAVDLGGAILDAPAISTDGILYLGTLGKEMLAVEAKTGKILWRTAIEGGVWATPAVSADAVYVGDLVGNFYSLSTKDGKILWKSKPDGPILGSPLLIPDGVVFTTEAGSVVTLDTKGIVLWTRDLKAKLYTAPVKTDDDHLVVAETSTESLLVIYDMKGSQMWTFTPPK